MLSASNCPTAGSCAGPRLRTSISSRPSPHWPKLGARRPSAIALAHYGLLEQPGGAPGRGPRDASGQGRDGEGTQGADIADALAHRRPATRRHRRGAQGEAGHCERRPPNARPPRRAARGARQRKPAPTGISPSALRVPSGAPTSDACQTTSLARSSSWDGPREVVEGVAFAKSSCSAARTPPANASGRPRRRRGEGAACSLAAALSSLLEMRSSIFALARSFLAWSRCNFPNVERARAAAVRAPFRPPGSGQELPARRLPCRCSCRTRPCKWASAAPSGGGGI